MFSGGAICGIVLSLILGVTDCFAQTELNILGLDTSSFPFISLNIQVKKNGVEYRDISLDNFQIYENGTPQNITTLLCPGDSTTRLSIAILMDRSESMTQFPDGTIDPDSSKLREAKKAILSFLDLLPANDETAMYSFSSPAAARLFFTVEQDYTKDKDLLKNCLVPVYAGGGTRMWQAVSEAIRLLRSRQGRKILIVLSDGRSEADQIFRMKAIQDAAADNITVFTIGLGNDADQEGLRSLAVGTGGLFLYSPHQSDLKAAFSNLATQIIWDKNGCLLKYNSTNSCLDGGKRELELVFNKGGLNARAETSYTITKGLNKFTISTPDGFSFASRSRILIPVYLTGLLSMLEPVRYSFGVTFDTTLLAFKGLVTDNTISSKGSVSVISDIGGVLLIEMNDALPAYMSGDLLALEFETRPVKTERSARISITQASCSQRCPTDISMSSGTLFIQPCGEHYLLETPPRPAFLPKQDMTIPVHISPPFPAGESVTVSFEVRYDVSRLTCLGVVPSHAGGLQATTRATPSGVSISVAGAVKDSSAGVVGLKFRANPTKQVQVYSLQIRNVSVETGCATTADAGDAEILIDGICEQLVVRKLKSSISVHPNPSNGRAEARFNLPVDGSVRLTLHDRLGRNVMKLLDGDLPRGPHSLAFALDTGIPGMYYLHLDYGGESTVVPVVLMPE